MSAPSVPNFPLFLYLYDEQGRYGNPTEIGNDAALETAMQIMVRDHISRGLEVRITNLADELMFHSQCGKVLWPTENVVHEMRDSGDGAGEG